MPLTPARLLDRHGTPYSAEYDDVYHSADGGVAQCRHVFLGGNGLPDRWRGRRRFTILELGFGLGLNFLTTWQTWRDDPHRCARLHYVAVEKHPLPARDLAAVLARYPALATHADALLASWPQLLPGTHRLDFDDGRLTLTLLFGDADDLLPTLRCAADAFYLDGFAPSRNPVLWSVRLMKHCARLATSEATVATYSVARPVREALQAAGFVIERAPGYGAKRDMLRGRLRPAVKHADTPAEPDRRALVIGAGVAGAAIAHALARRDWNVLVLDAADVPARGASGLPAGVVHPHLSPDDSLLSQAVRAAYLLSLRHWRKLAERGHATGWRACGVAHPAHDRTEEVRMAATLAQLGFPEGHAQYLDREALSLQCGVTLAHGGWWYPEGGVLTPQTLIAAQFSDPRIVFRGRSRVARLVRGDAGWAARDADDNLLASAPSVIVATALATTTLVPLGAALQSAPGLATRLPCRDRCLRAAIVGEGHVLPLADGGVVAGSTYGEIEAVRDRARNRSTLARLAPACRVDDDGAEDYGGVRAATADHLPLIGAAADPPRMTATTSRLAVPRQDGLYVACGYGSRGLAWAALGAAIITSQLEGEPLPVSGTLADVCDPARFLLKAARRRQ